MVIQSPRHVPGRDYTRPGDKREPRRITATTNSQSSAGDDTRTDHAEARGNVISSLALGVTRRAIALVATVAVLLISFVSSVSVYLGQRRDIAALETEIAARKLEIANLEDEFNRWQDPAYVRAQARERLGWVMPGEIGYRVIDAEGNVIGGTALSPVPDEDEVDPLWYEVIWESLQSADFPVPVEPTVATQSPPATVGPDATESPR